MEAERARLEELKRTAEQPEAVPAVERDAEPERKPRIMLIDGATDDECRLIGQYCRSLGISGTFKVQR